MLALDEMIDGGMIIECDPQQVVSRVALRADDIPLGEQTVAQVGNDSKAFLSFTASLQCLLILFFWKQRGITHRNIQE